MINELLPVQFVEGLNECGETYPDDETIIFTRNYAKMAIQYEPSLSSVLSQIEISLYTSTATQGNKSIKVSVNPDYEGRPSDIPLLETNNTFQPEACMEQYKTYWQKINLSPVIVVAKRIYWFVFHVDRCAFGFTLADKGETTRVMVTPENRWRDYSEHSNTRIMMKVFGRVIPLPIS